MGHSQTGDRGRQRRSNHCGPSHQPLQWRPAVLLPDPSNLYGIAQNGLSVLEMSLGHFSFKGLRQFPGLGR